MSTRGSLAVRRVRVSAPVRMPGAMTPPRKTPSAVMQSKVVAVPRSTTMVSRPYRRAAARVLAIRSAPTVSGSSTSRRTGSIGFPGSSTRAAAPTCRSHARASA